MKMSMEVQTRSLSPQESRVALALSERGLRGVSRKEIIELLGASPKAVDNIIESLRRKGWLERASWGKYLLIPADQGPEALGNSNLLAQASLIVDPYYIGYGTAAAHYGLTTQHRNVIFLVTPMHVRARRVADAQVRIVNPSASKFFGFEPVDVLGYKVMISDREKTAIDCVDRPTLAGGVGEAATILATASRRFEWKKAADYLRRMESGALVRRFGWFADRVKADMPADVRERLLAMTGRSTRAWLGPAPEHSVPHAIGYDETWRLYVNVTREELRGSAGVGQRKSLRKDS
jgi:predicted transcriptional regulator of viral defense system